MYAACRVSLALSRTAPTRKQPFGVPTPCRCYHHLPYVRRTSQGGRLLPPVTFWETTFAAVEGLWSMITDQSARDWYERAVQQKIIQDRVLDQAPSGSVMTYALFHNLKLLSEKYQLDVEEFNRAVGPAMENFYDTLGCLRNKLGEDRIAQANTSASSSAPSQDSSQQRQEGEGEATDTITTAQQMATQLAQKLTKDKHNNGGNESLASAVFGINKWRQQAKADPNSSAAKLQRMTTENCFDDLYYANKLHIDLLMPLLFVSSSSSTNNDDDDDDAPAVREQTFHVPGTTVINEVALLRARVMEVPSPSGTPDNGPAFGPKTYQEYDKYQEPNDPSYSSATTVAAQMDVLLEMSDTVETRKIVLRPGTTSPLNEETANPSAAPQQDEIDNNKTSSDSSSSSSNTTTITTLLVVELEGYIQGGLDESAKQHGQDEQQPSSSSSRNPSGGLRWRVASSRPAFEFPNVTMTNYRGDDKNNNNSMF